jgi:hypothetical protein
MTEVADKMKALKVEHLNPKRKEKGDPGANWTGE